MQYVTHPSVHEFAESGLHAAALRDDGTVTYEINGARHEAPHLPDIGKQLAIGIEGLWCVTQSGRVFFWKPPMKRWRRNRSIRRATGVSTLPSGEVCVGTIGGKALTRTDSRWQHSDEAARWLGVRKQPSSIKFGLRSLMLAILLVAACLGPVRTVLRARLRHRTLEIMEARGNSYTYVHELEGGKLDLPWIAKAIGEEVFYELNSLSIHDTLTDLRGELAEDFASAKHLTLSDISSLDGIEQFKNLRSLELPYCPDDISALADAPWITELEITDAGVDLTVVAKLPNLRRLFYAGRVDTLEPLVNLTKLESLYILDLNGPSRRIDPSVLRQLTNLRELTIGRCRDLRGLDWLAGMSELRVLRLGGIGEIEDLSPLNNLKHLEELHLPDGTTFDMTLFDRLPHLDFGRCGVSIDANWDEDFFNGWEEQYEAGFSKLVHYKLLDLSRTNATRVPLAANELAEFTSIDLAGTQVADLSFLRHASSIKSLDLSDTPVEDLSVLRELPQLESVRLEGCRIADISALSELRQLFYLDLRRTDVTDLSPLRGLTSLESIDLGFTNVRDLSPVKDLYRLNRLYLTGVAIENIDWLKSLRFLRDVDLSRTKVRDISALRDLQLKFLGLYFTQVQDLSPLVHHSSLTDIRLKGSPIKDITPLRWANKLQYVNLDGLKLDDATLVFGEQNETLRMRGVPLSKLPTGKWLKRLEFDCSRIADLSPLVAATRLERLVLENIQPHHDLEWLSKTAVEQLEITGDAPVRDVSPICRMNFLRELRLPQDTAFSREQATKMKELVAVYVGDVLVYLRRGYAVESKQPTPSATHD